LTGEQLKKTATKGTVYARRSSNHVKFNLRSETHSQLDLIPKIFFSPFEYPNRTRSGNIKNSCGHILQKI